MSLRELEHNWNLRKRGRRRERRALALIVIAFLVLTALVAWWLRL